MFNKHVLSTLGCLVALAVSALADGVSTPVKIGRFEAHPTRILARTKAVAGTESIATATIQSVGLEVQRRVKLVPGLLILDMPAGSVSTQSLGQDPAAALLARISALRRSGQFEYVEPDYLRYVSAVPSDTRFADGTLWGLQNTGQQGGVAGADIDVVRAWDITTGKATTIVAVIDSGVRYSHQDLTNRMWINPGEIAGNRIDDDGNGYVDDVHGINSINNTGNPMDDNDHGTHCSGTIGASANDAGPHVGVAWQVRIMALKFLNAAGSGATSGAIECLDYAVAMGAKISNNSWGGGGYSQALYDSIAAARDASHLFVAAAGNESLDNDLALSYPASYDLDNIVSVAALNRRDGLANFSNFGLTTVDLGAPGVDIYSSISTSDTAYDLFDGTSMASPHVAGVAALLLSAFPGADYSELRDRLLLSTVPVRALAGRCTTGGRVSAYKALTISSDGQLEMKVSPPDGYVAVTRSTVPVFVRVTDIFSVVNATVTGTSSTGGTLTFKNDGAAPDVLAGDAVYTASLTMPATPTNVSLTLVAMAPGKQGTTNTVHYVVLPPPPNDMFANASKVPTQGGYFLANNVFGTMETNEPAHADVSTCAASLWWNFAPTNSGDYLVDLTGTTFDTLLAVYTGTSVTSLTQVASVDNVDIHDQGYLSFSATAGTTYRIAVAGYDTNQSGGVRMRIERNGSVDTNPPVVSVSGPLNGQSFTTNLLTLTGSATDPIPNASGISEIYVLVNDDKLARVAAGTTNWAAPLLLREGANQIRVSAADFFGNVSTQTVIQVTVLPPAVTNDFLAQAARLTATPELSVGNSVNATKEIGEPNHAGNGGGKSVWWFFQAPADGVLTLSTTNSSFDTLLAIYTGTGVGALTAVADNDDAYPEAPGGFSRLVQAVRAGQTYRIAVDGYGGAAGSVYLHYAFVPGSVLHLSVDSPTGGTISPGSGDYGSNTVVTFTATPAAQGVFMEWQIGGLPAYANPVSVTVKSNLTLSASFLSVAASEGFESGDLTSLPWTTAGALPWTVQSNTAASGSFAAQSGAIGDNQSSALRLTSAYRGGPASFAYRVSSEDFWDTLNFYVDGTLQQQWSGDTGWQTWNFSLSAGQHTLEWRYVKDAGNRAGLDAAFLDDLRLPLVVATNASSAANLSIVGTYGGSYALELLGQTNQQYVVQSSTNLVNWTPLVTNIAVGGVLHFGNPAGITNPAMFYRAVVP